MSLVTFEDVINFAVEREEAAYRLYLGAAAQSKSIASRKMLEDMAKEEAGHKQFFGNMNLEKVEQYRKITIPDMKMDMYLVEKPLKPDASYQEVLAYAIQAEEKAYQLYMAAADAINDADLQKTLRVFADVEKGHKIKVQKLYDDHVYTEN